MSARRTLGIARAIAATAILAACSASPSGTAAVQTPSGATSASPPAASPSDTSTTATVPAAPRPRVTEVNPSGDIPDNQAFVAFSPAGTGYSVKVPEGWARTSSSSTTSFTDKLNQIEMSSGPAPSRPTIASVRKSDAPSLRAKVPMFAMGKVSVVVRKGGTAILLTYQGDSATNPVTGKVVRDAFERYTFYRAGRRVDLTLSGPTNADNVDPWLTVSDSLRWS